MPFYFLSLCLSICMQLGHRMGTFTNIEYFYTKHHTMLNVLLRFLLFESCCCYCVQNTWLKKPRSHILNVVELACVVH